MSICRSVAIGVAPAGALANGGAGIDTGREQVLLEATEAEPRTPEVREIARPTSGAATAWWRVAVIGAVALALALGFLEVASLFARPLAFLFLAIVIAAAVTPVVDRLARWLPRTLAVAVVYLAILALLGGLLWLLVPPLVSQARSVIPNGGSLLEESRAWIGRWDPGGGDRVIGLLESNLNRLVASLAGLPLAIVSSVTELLLVLVMSAYWLIAVPALRRFGLSLLPHGRRERVDDLLTEIGRVVGGYARATVIDGLIIGAIVYVGLRLIGVNFPLLLALAAFVGEFVPVAGPIVAAIPALVVALLQAPGTFLVTLVFYLVVQQFESNILLPLIMRKQAHVPPVLGAFAFFAGAAAGGILGALIAIPIAAMVRVIVLRVVAPAVRSWTGADNPTGVHAEVTGASLPVDSRDA